MNPSRLLLSALAVAASLTLIARTGHANVYLVGGQTQRSTDGGTTWTSPDGLQLEGVSLVNGSQDTVVAVGAIGLIRRSTNAGSTWTTVTSPTSANLNDVCFSGATGYAVGNNVILKSVNNGATWTLLSPASPAPFGTYQSVFFTSATNGVIVGDNGTMYHTTDGGTHWTSLPNAGATLNDVQFQSVAAGFTVGFFGKFGKSTDGGATWTFSVIDSQSDLFGVHFISSTTGWAVGTLGKVFKTTNGGTTWTAAGTTIGNTALRCVDFMNDQEGIIGGDGVSLRTLDGGTTWHDVVGFTGIRADVAVSPAPLLANRVPVTVTSNPAGRTVTVDGATLTGPTNVVWLTSELHPVAAISPQVVSANEQYLFASWSDGGGSSHNAQRGTTTPFTLTVNYTRQFKLTMASNGGGTVSPTTGFHNAGSVVGISATASAGFTFANWAGTGTGSFSGTTSSANVTMNGPITESGTFAAAPFQVTVHTGPTGRSFTVDGTTFTTTQTFTWTTGSSHTLGTTGTQSAGTGSRYLFTSWSDGGAQNHTVTASPSVTSYTANFQLQYFLTMVSASGRYTPSPGDGWHNAGSTVSIDAVLHPTIIPIVYFASWAGTGSGSYTGPLQQQDIVMNGPITETMQFTTLINRLVWIGTSPASRTYRVGTTSYTGWNPFRFIIGSSFSLSTDSLQAANGTSRSRFLDWSDALPDTHTVTVGLSGPDTLLARFRGQYLLTMNAATGGTVTPPTDYKDAGSVVVVQATPSPNFAFIGWTGVGIGSVSGGQNPAIATMNTAIIETANFLGLPVLVTIRTLPTGGQFKVNGTTVTSTLAFTPPAGTPIDVEAIPITDLDSAKRLVFDSWSDGGAAAHTITPMAAMTLTANEHVQFLVTTQVAAGGGGTVTPSAYVDDGGHVTLTATPDAGRTFLGWTGTGSGAYTGTNNPITLGVGNAFTEVATFNSNVGVGDGEPLAFALAQNAPNPVHDRGTLLSFTLPAVGDVRLDVIDLAGRCVATPAAGRLEAGRHEIAWRAEDGSRRPLGAGVYYYRLRWNGRELTRRMVVAR